MLTEQTAAAASEEKMGGGDASLDVEQLARALTPQDQERFPELHNVRAMHVCLLNACLFLSFGLLHVSHDLCAPV